MRTYGITTADVMDAIRTHRKAIAFWTARNGDDFRISVSDGKRAEIVTDHTASIRDLRIMLLSVRFPENTFPVFTYGDDFTPVIVADTNDESTNDESTNDESTNDESTNDESTTELVTA